LIKLDQYSITYYKNVPKDYSESDGGRSCPSLENGTTKPKGSIPLKKIITVSEVSEEDQKKFKKLAKAPDVGMKV
jgi:hypothetical protein